MQILIESPPHYFNMGDVAMLQVCMRRLRALWPAARWMVMTSDPVPRRGTGVRGFARSGFRGAGPATPCPAGWRAAAECRPSLLAAAARQIELTRAAYAAIAHLVQPGERDGWQPPNYTPELVNEWWRRRLHRAAIECGEVTRYLAKVEEARDWNHERAERFEAELRVARRGG